MRRCRRIRRDRDAFYLWKRTCIVTFADPGDMTLLGAIALQSLNLRLDLARRERFPAGPVLVAEA